MTYQLDQHLAAVAAGGTTTYGALLPGAHFRFPRDHTRLTKLPNGWYRSPYSSRKYRTGSHTAVVEVP